MEHMHHAHGHSHNHDAAPSSGLSASIAGGEHLHHAHGAASVSGGMPMFFHGCVACVARPVLCHELRLRGISDYVLIEGWKSEVHAAHAAFRRLSSTPCRLPRGNCSGQTVPGYLWTCLVIAIFCITKEWIASWRAGVLYSRGDGCGGRARCDANRCDVACVWQAAAAHPAVRPEPRTRLPYHAGVRYATVFGVLTGVCRSL
jgi:hypothetical protein